MNTYTFAPKTMTCNGHTYTVGYCLQPSGVVTVFVQLDDRQARIRIDKKMPEYAAARAAAEEARDAWNADTTAPTAPVDTPAAPADDIPAPAPTATADDTPAPAPERAEIISPAAPAVPAAPAAPEKTFIGTEIAGNGWKIIFDAATQRTRIIFAADPTPAAKKALDAAGFFYSGKMQSWNKKLTFRAYRAAQAIANDLRTIYPT